MLAVADVVEAMSSHRPYRAALGIDAAIAEIKSLPDKSDTKVVEACVRPYEAVVSSSEPLAIPSAVSAYAQNISGSPLGLELLVPAPPVQDLHSCF